MLKSMKILVLISFLKMVLSSSLLASHKCQIVAYSPVHDIFFFGPTDLNFHVSQVKKEKEIERKLKQMPEQKKKKNRDVRTNSKNKNKRNTETKNIHSNYNQRNII
jgi:hypothetical protein